MTPRDLETHDCTRFRFPGGAIIPWQFEKNGDQVEVAVEGRLRPRSSCYPSRRQVPAPLQAFIEFLRESP